MQSNRQGGARAVDLPARPGGARPGVAPPLSETESRPIKGEWTGRGIRGDGRSGEVTQFQ